MGDEAAARNGRRASRRRPPPADIRWAWFFDIDGTLVELAREPSGIVLEDEMARLLADLHFVSGGAVALVTGRQIADVDELLHLRGIPIAGQHGLEVRQNQIVRVAMEHDADQLASVVKELEQVVARHPALLLENKDACVALHYRKAPQLGGYANRLMKSLRDRLAPDFAIQQGKRVVELKPLGRDKGHAVEHFMEEPPFKGRLPVFAGDDLTDESAFHMINRMNGHSIKIGSGPTAARWRLRDIFALREWLEAGIQSVARETTAHNQ